VLVDEDEQMRGRMGGWKDGWWVDGWMDGVELRCHVVKGGLALCLHRSSNENNKAGSKLK